MSLPKYEAYWTCEKVEGVGYLYYFSPVASAKPPYTKQIRVTAIIDISDDGDLAGVELIENMPPPPEGDGEASL